MGLSSSNPTLFWMRPARFYQVWVALLLPLLLLGLARDVKGLGVNWGTQATHQLPPDIVVQMLKDNNFDKVKLFDTNKATLKALAGTDIEVMVAIPNKDLQGLQDSDAAESWVDDNVKPYVFNGGVNIKYVGVANEPFLTAYNNSYVPLTFPALQNIQNALNKWGHGDTIKATVPMNADVLTDSGTNLPSHGIFRPDISAEMLKIVTFLNQSGSPYSVNIYPFISYATNPEFPESYAYFDSNTAQVTDGANVYTNTFDASYDTLVQALTEAGFPNMPIILGEIGWATDGVAAATPANAQRFNQGFLDHVQGNKGTPRRPNTSIEYYLFGLLDEDNKDTAPGLFERHWGIFTFDGNAKYVLNVSGAPVNSFGNGTLVNAKGVPHLPEVWCVAVDNADPAKLEDSVNFACSNADCTQLSYGCSCNGLDAQGNASFAFNQYFQIQNQITGSCGFNGLAQTTTTDPSRGTCKFIVQLDVPTSSAAHSFQAAVASTLTALASALLCIFLLLAPPLL